MSKHRTRPKCGTSQTKINENIEEMEAIPIIGPDDDDEQLKLKAAMRSLSKEDMRILSYYAELGSYRKMAALLGASATTWRREINRIRGLIKSKL